MPFYQAFIFFFILCLISKKYFNKKSLRPLERCSNFKFETNAGFFNLKKKSKTVYTRFQPIFINFSILIFIFRMINMGIFLMLCQCLKVKSRYSVGIFFFVNKVGALLLFTYVFCCYNFYKFQPNATLLLVSLFKNTLNQLILLATSHFAHEMVIP